MHNNTTVVMDAGIVNFIGVLLNMLKIMMSHATIDIDSQ